MARAEPIRLGPFVGGINTSSDPTAVADSELVDCINFELDIDGSLVSRPPIVETTDDSASWSERIVIIGRGSFGATNYLIGSNSDGTYSFDGTTWVVIKASLHSSVALQYNDNMYIIPVPGTKATQAGGRWNPTEGFVVDSDMPEGESAVFNKSRLFICPGILATTNPSRLRFSDIIASTTLGWTSTNIIDVSPGDGQVLIDCLIYNDNLLLFKNDSTYVLAYDTKPSDAILRNINSTIGVTTRRCVVPYQNSIFVFHEGSVYEVVNYDFNKINIKTPFLFDGTTPSGTTRAEDVFLSLLGDRLLIRYFNRVYDYGLNTRTWTRWDSKSDLLKNFGPLMAFPTDAASASNTKYFCGSSIHDHQTMYYIQDGYDAITRESETSTDFDIECYMLTKNYDLSDSHHFKRMMWWGADILTTRDVTGRAIPIIISFQVLWSDLATLTWEDLADKTWGQPLSLPEGITTVIVNSSTAGRLFTKFLKSLRFREIKFELTLLNTGTTVEGPCRVFTITALIGSKETVTKQVN